eukprot:TRINITY_DN9348_c0_g1_i1.p1 TRINITY_DN9348_c0_g1~~TRINITY_DN9348_c0_g1_i1.p1  ORF type:complete len:320 (-),score=74.08 TRINITY_DN9348_c0_g1_i1:181-1083(-)
MQVVKIVLVGDETSGKTELSKGYTLGSIDDNNGFGSNTFSRTIDRQGKSVTCHLVSTSSGAEDKLRPLAYPQTDIFLFLYSIASPTSFENIKSKWLPEVRNYCPHTPFLVVGTQEELRETQPHHKFVSFETATSACKELGAMALLECSYVTHKNVDLVFEQALTFFLDPPLELSLPRSSSVGNGDKKKLFWSKSRSSKLKKSPRDDTKDKEEKSITSPRGEKEKPIVITPRDKKRVQKSRGNSPVSDISPQNEKQAYTELVNDLISAQDEIRDLKKELLIRDSLIINLEKEIAFLRQSQK